MTTCLHCSKEIILNAIGLWVDPSNEIFPQYCKSEVPSDVKHEPKIDWEKAFNHSIETLKLYNDLVDIPKVLPYFGIAYIRSLLKRYESGERTEELYEKMLSCE